MKIQHSIAIAVLSLVVFAAGCSSPSKRISKNQQLFDTFPAEVQSAIRAGNVDIGFTPEMVVMALGEPARRYTRTTERGASEVWAYKSSGMSPSFSFGLGMGMGMRGGGRTAVGSGVGVSTGGGHADDRVRIVFENGKVTAVEQVK